MRALVVTLIVTALAASACTDDHVHLARGPLGPARYEVEVRASGNVPVYPYPAARQRVQIAWVWASYRNEVDFDVVLLPRKRAGVGPMSAGVDMKATGTGALRRWRVDSFTPREFYAP